MKIRIPVRYAPLLFGGMLSTTMVALISGMMTVFRDGIHSGFLSLWASGFLSTWPIAFPTALVVAPLVRRAVERLTRD